MSSRIYMDTKRGRKKNPNIFVLFSIKIHELEPIYICVFIYI